MANTEHSLPAGYRIGAYEIVQLLGAGTFGNVYLCRHAEVGELVAIREYMPFDTAVRDDSMAVRASLPAAEGTFLEGLSAFRERARLMASLDHPHLVRVREQLDVNGTAYVVMDYAQGRPLSQLLPAAGTIEESELARYLRPVAESLMAMHEAGVVHGSLGLDSVVVTEDGVPQLLGLAVPARDVFGTVAKPGFAPIEQYSASSGLATRRTDVYSLGALLYRCVTGLTPPEAPIRAERETLVPAARSRGRRRYSAGLLAAIDAALTLDPEGRPERIDVLHDALPAVEPPAPEEPAPPPEEPAAPAAERSDAVQEEAQPEPATETAVRSGARGRMGGVPSTAGRSRKVLAGALAAVVVIVGVGLVALLDDGETPSLEPAPVTNVPPAPLEGVASEPAEELPQPLPETPEVLPETVPAPSEETVAVTSSLAVSTIPSGAEVYLEGEAVGETPLQLDDLAAATYRLSLQHPLYETVDLEVPLDAGATLEVERELIRATGTLELALSPENAWVERDGERLAEGTPVTLADLPAGTMTLTVGAPGHETMQVTAVVPKGGVESLDLTLDQALGALTLALVPADAQVEFPDREESYSPGMPLAEGPHRLIVSRQGYASATQTVEVQGATVHEIVLEPVAQPFTVAADPPSAAISFQGGEIDYTPGMELMPGEYELEVQLLGYESWSGTVRHDTEPTVHAVSLTFVSHEYADELSSGGTGPSMTVVPAGRFSMGCRTLADCPESELPVHDVNIDRPFAISRYEVTFAEFERFVRATGRDRPDDQGWGRGNRPVIGVSWDDATAYVEWLSSVTGRSYRLPSEAEWEYAARAGSDTAYAFGEAIDGNANCDGCTARSTGRSLPVGGYRANAWGLYDMHGNVWEWTQDCSAPSYEGAPTDGAAALGGDCSRRILRGGSWFNTSDFARSAARLSGSSTVRGNIAGFRVVADIE